jgi:membrane protein
MASMLERLQVRLSWTEILRRTFTEAFIKDNCLGMAAQLAYYFFFALFPTLLVLLAIAQYFLDTETVLQMFTLMGSFVPPDALRLITDQITKIRASDPGGILTIGVLTAIWSSSAAMTAIIDTLNNAYDIEEGRPWWKVRLTAIGLTIGVSLFILIAFTLVLFGPAAAEWIADATRLGSAFEWTWKVLQWPLVFAFVSTAMAIVYYFAPDAEQDWVWLTPGALFATTLWLLASLGFKYYVANFGSYDTETYGAIGAVMVLMLWFYISGLVVLIGAEMNAEIEHASPYGKDEGEKVPGQKRRIGVAAMRAWVKRRQGQGANPPSAAEVKGAVGETPEAVVPPARTAAPPAAAPEPSPASPAPLTPAAATAFSDYLIGAGVVVAQVWLAIGSFRRNRA